MKKHRYIYTDGDHIWSCLYNDPEKENYLIDTNEYIVSKSNHLMLLDPGGLEVFPAVFSSISSEMDPKEIEFLFASHQDPDIISSLALWLEINPSIRVFTSYVWSSFLPHYGGNAETFISLPDDGGEPLQFHGLKLDFIPAHYMHSSGNFHLYDEKARILFSGDIGAALLPAGQTGKDEIFVADFSTHIRFAEGFHRRWMPSNRAKNDWCDRVSKLKIDFLCPQHGLIYEGEDVQRFLEWFRSLEVGVTKTYK